MHLILGLMVYTKRWWLGTRLVSLLLAQWRLHCPAQSKQHIRHIWIPYSDSKLTVWRANDNITGHYAGICYHRAHTNANTGKHGQTSPCYLIRDRIAADWPGSLEIRTQTTSWLTPHNAVLCAELCSTRAKNRKFENSSLFFLFISLPCAYAQSKLNKKHILMWLKILMPEYPWDMRMPGQNGHHSAENVSVNENI